MSQSEIEQAICDAAVQVATLPDGKFVMIIPRAMSEAEVRAEYDYWSRCATNRILYGADPFAAGWWKWYLRTPSMWRPDPSKRWWT
jgi:hypothetical protein